GQGLISTSSESRFFWPWNGLKRFPAVSPALRLIHGPENRPARANRTDRNRVAEPSTGRPARGQEPRRRAFHWKPRPCFVRNNGFAPTTASGRVSVRKRKRPGLRPGFFPDWFHSMR